MPQEPREYDRVELVWPGKRTEVERVRLPFQTIERVNDVRASAASGAQGGLLTSASQLPDWWPEGWRNRLIWGDNKYVLSSLLDEFAGKVDLIYIDPPFATGQDFSYSTRVGETEVEKLATAVEEVAYRDTWGKGVASYLQVLYERLVVAKELLQPNGTMYVHVDHRLVTHVKFLLDEVLGADHFLNLVTWRRQIVRGMKTHARFMPHSADYLLIYGSQSGATWNELKTETFISIEEAERKYQRDSRGFFRTSDPGTYSDESLIRLHGEGRIHVTKGGEFVVENGRVRTTTGSIGVKYYREQRGDKVVEEGTVDNIWDDVPGMGVVSSEYVGFPTQQPLGLLERVIEASSRPSDVVLDFFCGSGTAAVAAERLGRRWIAVDLGRFAVQTTRKRLLNMPGCRPFEVLNLGRYERRYWQGLTAGETVWEYYKFILDLYRAQAISGFTQLHGQKESRFVHVGATDAPVTFDEVARTLEECAANGLKAVDVLGWEWEMGLNPAGKDDLARKHGIDVRLIHVPREVMDKRAVDAGDVHFFELSVAAVRAEASGREASVVLDDFLPAIDEYMRQKVGDKAAKWSDWIDYWSVDFEHDGETYINQWQSYRTRKDPRLALRSAPHVYASPGTYRVVVKVIDIFGNDTTQHLDVTVN